MKNKTKERVLLTAITILIILVIFMTTWFALSERQRGLYDVDTYNCSDMTYDCEKLFNSMGIETTVMYGHNRIDGKIIAHKWLKVHTIFGDLEFESTTLTFKKVSEDYDNVYSIER